MPIHSLLARQLKQFFPGVTAFSKEWQAFIDTVDQTYREADEDRSMLERSLELSSQELLQANSEMRAVVQAFPDIFFHLNADGTILNYKGGSLTDFYLPPKKLIGKRIQDVPLGDVKEQFDAAINAVRSGKKIVSLEYGLAEDYYEARLVPMPEHQILAIVRNITEHKRADAALRASEDRFRLIAETITEVFWSADVEMNVMTYVSPAYESIWGRTCASLYDNPRSFLDTIHPEDLERVLATLAIQRVGQPFDHEYRIIRPDSSIRWIWDRGFPVCDHRGHINRYVGVAQDITERKRAEEALQASEKRFALFMNNSPSLAWMKDEAGTYFYVNEPFERFHRITLKELEGKTDCAFLSEKVAHEVAANDRQALSSDKVLETVEAVPDPDGVSHQWLVFRFPFVDFAGKRFVGGLAIDITERKRAEQEKAHLEDQLRQAQKMEAVGRLAGGIAHDFNNVLTVILGYSNVLLQTLSPADSGYEDIEQIKTAGARAAGLTRQLLAFSRRQVLQPKVLDLNQVVTGTTAMLQRLIGEDIVLKTSLDPTLKRITADPGQLEQVIMNLAVNARDAMSCGGQLTIETANIEVDQASAAKFVDLASGSYVMLAVRDTGFGMDADTQARIFEPFFTTKGPGEGTGLGLAMVYGFVKQSGGWIGVESEVGLGSTFRIYLPRGMGRETWPVAAHTEGPIPKGRGTILLAEDQDAVRTLTRKVLESCGYTVLEAGSAKEALSLSEGHAGPIDLLITDVIMPGGSGQHVAKSLTASRPGLKALFVSGYTDEAIFRHGAFDPGQAFLQKPFSPLSLASKVREVLEDSPGGCVRLDPALTESDRV